MEISIVSATNDRAESFWRALDEVARERRFLLFTEAPSYERTRDFVAEVLSKGWSQFYAIYEDRVVGWCDIIRHERAGMTHSGHLGMGVLPGFRGMGIGRRLLTSTIEDAFQKGIDRIELEVFASNQRAIALYHAAGFVEEGRKRRARFLDGEYDAFVLMALLREET